MRISAIFRFLFKNLLECCFRRLTNFYQDDNIAAFNYWFEGKRYRVLINRERIKPFTAESDTGEDITEILREYAGPAGNFHGVYMKPRNLACRRITIRSLGEETSFDVDEQIVIPKRTSRVRIADEIKEESAVEKDDD